MRNFFIVALFFSPLLVFGQASTDNWVFHHQPSDNWFSSLAEDKFGNIIAGGGEPNSDFRIYDGNSWTLHTSASLGVPYSVLGRELATDTNGVVWISPGGAGDGVVSWDGSNTVKYDTTNSDINFNYIGGIGVDADNQLWLSNLQSFNGVAWSEANFTSVLCEDQAQPKCFISSSNEAWFTDAPKADIHNFNNVHQPCVTQVSNWNGTAYHADNGSNLPIFNVFTPFQGFHLINELSDGTLFIAGKTANGIELKTYDGSDWVDWTSYGGPEVAISYTCVWVDENDNIFLGGSKDATTSQIAKFCNSDWTFYNLPESMGFPHIIQDILIDQSSRMWIAGANGLCSLDYISVPCMITETETSTIQLNVEMYFSGEFLVITGLPEPKSFEILNMLGQSVSNGIVNRTFGRIGDLKTGVYGVRIRTVSGSNWAGKIFKQ